MIPMKERSDLIWSDRTQDMSGLSKNEVASDTARHAEHNNTQLYSKSVRPALSR